MALRRGLDRTLTRWLVFLLIAISGSTWLAYLSLNQILQNDQRVAFSESLLDQLDLILSTVKDAETGQRGFIITGDESYLAPYDQAVAALTQHLQETRKMTVDDPDQARLLPFLEQAIAAKQRELKDTIDLRRSVSFSAAQAVVLTSEGRNSMEDVRRIVGSMEAHENERLRARMLESAESSRRAKLTIAGDGVMGVILILIFNLSLRRHVRERTMLLEQEAAARTSAERAFEGERRARDRAEQASRLKDEFLASVSHELRTPLNAILGWARMLRAGTVEQGGTQRGLESIERNAVAQAQLVEDLLDISRIVSGRLRLEVAHVDLASVVRAAVDVVKPAADAKRIHVETVIDRKATGVIGDSQRLQQVIWNLLSNSVKFTPSGGHVRVELHGDRSHAVLLVRDDGAGINPDFLPHVFELFRQADAGPSRKQGGLGLGLAIVRRIVEMHGGTIRAESEGDGQGASFIVNLPLEERREGEPHPPVDPFPAVGSLDHSLTMAPRLDGLKVLAVDDQADTLEMIEEVLRRCGAETRTSITAGDAISVLKSWQPDMLIADIGLPEEDGYALIQRVRNLPRDQGGGVPAVALTAYTRVEDRMRALSAGFQMHVSKPVEPLELVTILDGLRTRA